MQQEDGTQCPICLGRFITPKALPCQHTFCLRCVESLVGHSSGNTISCPICRADYQIPPNGASGFRTNYDLERLIRVITLPGEPDGSETDITTINPNRRTRRAQHNRRVPQVTRNFNTVRQQSIPTVSSTIDRTNNVIANRQQEEVDLMVALQILAEERNTGQEEHRIRRGEQETGNLGLFRRIRQKKQRIVYALLNDDKEWLSILITVFILATLGRLVAGAVKLSSNCDLERQVAIYLLVKACVSAFFWTALTLWSQRRNAEAILNNPFVETYIYLDLLFSLSWLIVGTVYIFGDFNHIKDFCEENVNKWNEHFMNFALALTIVDYIGLGAFILFCGYKICESTN